MNKVIENQTNMINIEECSKIDRGTLQTLHIVKGLVIADLGELDDRIFDIVDDIIRLLPMNNVECVTAREGTLIIKFKKGPNEDSLSQMFDLSGEIETPDNDVWSIQVGRTN